MNERIKELAEQSLPNVKYWNEEVAKGDTPPKNRAITLDELKKFAELIVRECIGMADEFEIEVNRSGLVDRMKEHFGVEK